MTRKPVGIAMVQDGPYGGAATVVVCDDGTCWFMDSGSWKQYTPIPGTAAHPDTRTQEAPHD